MKVDRVVRLAVLAFVVLGCVFALVGALRAEEEESRFPFVVGDQIRLMYQDGAGYECTVREVRGSFVACANRTRDEWFNLAWTLGIERKRK